MTFIAKFEADGTITAGPLSDGQTWKGITPSSRFWNEVMSLTSSGTTIQPHAAPALTVVDYQNAVQAIVDKTAVAKQFNDGVTMASYVSSTVEPWAAQAQAFVAWRDDVWQYAYSELAKVQGGVRPQPAIDDFLRELPDIVWP